MDNQIHRAAKLIGEKSYEINRLENQAGDQRVIVKGLVSEINQLTNALESMAELYVRATGECPSDLHGAAPWSGDCGAACGQSSEMCWKKYMLKEAKNGSAGSAFDHLDHTERNIKEWPQWAKNLAGIKI